MSKTLQEMQIEVARYWAGVEEMKNCPWWLVIERPIPWPGLLIEDARQVHTRIINCANEDGEVDHEYWEREFSSDQFCQREIQPYLKIEDGNPWSSAAILARIWPEDIERFPTGGFKVTWVQTLFYKGYALVSVNYERALANGKIGPDDPRIFFCFLDLDLPRGNDELAHNLALQWLHKNAPEVWAKGMEALR